MTNLYDDPQLIEADWLIAATEMCPDEFTIPLDAEVWHPGDGEDGAYVQAWVFVNTENAQNRARDRQATAFNNAQRGHPCPSS